MQVKLLKIGNAEERGVNNLDKFIQGLNNVLEHPIEIANKIDSNYNGYYLLPIGSISCSNFSKSIVNEKTFLLSVINSSIPQYIETFKPAGVTNWMLFKNASTSIIGRKEVIEKVYKLEEGDNVLYEDLGYDDYIPLPFDGTYETVAKSILSYLEVYDKWLKSK